MLASSTPSTRAHFFNHFQGVATCPGCLASSNELGDFLRACHHNPITRCVIVHACCLTITVPMTAANLQPTCRRDAMHASARSCGTEPRSPPAVCSTAITCATHKRDNGRKAISQDFFTCSMLHPWIHVPNGTM